MACCQAMSDRDLLALGLLGGGCCLVDEEDGALRLVDLGGCDEVDLEAFFFGAFDLVVGKSSMCDCLVALLVTAIAVLILLDALEYAE